MVMEMVNWSHTNGYSGPLFLTALIFPLFVIPIALLRFWTGKYIVKRWFPDDALAITALVRLASHMFAICHSVLTCIEARLGGGDYIANVNPTNITLLLKVGRFGGVPLYNLTTFFVKASILVFYLRFSWETSFRIVDFIVIFLVFGYSLVNTISSFALVCSSPSKCSQLFIVFIVCAAMNVFTDLIILLLPFWLLWPVKLSFGRKLAIGIVLMAGGFVIGVSIFRLIVTIDVRDDADATYAWGKSVLWSLIETWAGLVCACLPCLKPFFTRFFPAWWSSIFGSSNTSERPMTSANS